MKAHEETWTGDVDGVVIATDRNMVAEVYGLPDTGNNMMVERALLISAAPDMARALLAFVSDDGHTPECGNPEDGRPYGCSTECRNARAALKKAGVLP